MSASIRSRPAARTVLALIPLAMTAAGCAETPARQPGPPQASQPRPAASAEVFVYPASGQDERQLDRDRYECHLWAVRQSQFDPSLPGLPPHQRVRVVAAGPPPGATVAAGAITGAAIGAAIGSPYDTGEGALVGAAAGAVLGAIAEDSASRQAARVEEQSDAEAAAATAEQEQRALGYQRAITACLEARGYSVR